LKMRSTNPWPIWVIAVGNFFILFLGTEAYQSSLSSFLAQMALPLFCLSILNFCCLFILGHWKLTLFPLLGLVSMFLKVKPNLVDPWPELVSGRSHEILQFNLRGSSEGNLKFLPERILGKKIQILTVQSCSSKCFSFLSNSLAKEGYYTVFHETAQLSIFSKFPLVQPDLKTAPNAIIARFQIKETQLGTLINVELPKSWPWGAAITQGQHLKQLETWVSAIKMPLVVAGNFNLVPWSESLRGLHQLLHFGAPNLRTLPYGNGPATLFDLELPSPFSLILWDQIYFSKHFKFEAQKTVGLRGADFFPVANSFELK
jgi:endonuclease/exonuclease/phosphatase (EEP) superfamily protein YafD